MAAEGLPLLPAEGSAASSEDGFVIRSGVRAGLKREFAFALRAQAELPPSLSRLRSRAAKTPPPPSPLHNTSSKKSKRTIDEREQNPAPGIGSPPGFPSEPGNKLKKSQGNPAEGIALESPIVIDGPEKMGASVEAPIVLGDQDGADGGNGSVGTATKRKMELKMSKKIAPTKAPTNVDELLATGFLEGLHVTYSTNEDKQVGLHGVARDDSILCYCPSCNGSKAVSASVFEQHAGSSKKSPSDYIYLENGKSLHDVLEVCTGASVDTLEVAIRNVIDPEPMKRPLTFQGCEGQPQGDPSLPHGMGSNARVVVGLDVADMASKSISSHKKTSLKLTRKDLGLHKLVFTSDTLPQGTEVAYYVRGKKLLEGYIKDFGIYCHCCNYVVSPSQFEAHAGQATRRKPYNYIYTSNGVSLHELSVSLSKDRKLSTSENDDLCSVCEDGGKLILCDLCPRSFHLECTDLSSIPKGTWYCKFCVSMHEREKFVENNDNAIAAGRDLDADAIGQIHSRCIRIVNVQDMNVGSCVLCRRQEFSTSGFNPHTVIICDQCEKEFHVGCLKDHNLADLKKLPVGNWFCSNDCSRVHSALQTLLFCGPVQISDPDLDIIKRKHEEKGLNMVCDTDVTWRLLSGKTASAESKLLLEEAISVLHESFDPIIDSKTKRDLIPIMVNGRNTRDQDFSGMYCAVLTVGSSVVSAGILRILGCEVAELPLVATSKKRQGEGYFQSLFSCIERLFASLKVKYFVLPAAEEAESIWIKKFGFAKITVDQLSKYTKGARTMVFHGTAVLHKSVPDSQIPEEPGKLLEEQVILTSGT